MNGQKKPITNEKKYTHISEIDLTEGKDISEILKGLDPLSRKLVAVYARGLSDMQETNSKVTV